jgi:hypothetical protein
LLAVTNVRRGLALLLAASLLWVVAYALSITGLPAGAWSNWLVLLIGIGSLGTGLAGLLRVICSGSSMACGAGARQQG